MADKILMNKNTLAVLKNELKGFHTALPVFEMKEQQLKETMQTIETAVERLEDEIATTNESIQEWIAVMAEPTVDLSNLISVKDVQTKKREIAGVVVEHFESIDFEEESIDFLNTPLWVDTALEVTKDQKTNLQILKLEHKNLERVQEELAEARRMKNALKEVFIPETKHNIRKIEIYLGDVERLSIGCAKLVKKKKQRKSNDL